MLAAGDAAVSSLSSSWSERNIMFKSKCSGDANPQRRPPDEVERQFVCVMSHHDTAVAPPPFGDEQISPTAATRFRATSASALRAASASTLRTTSALRAITNASLARRASRKEVWRATRASRSSLYWHWAGGLGVNFRSPTSFAVIARVPAAAHPCVVSSKRHRQEARVSLRSQSEAGVSLRSQSEAGVSLRVLLYCGRTRTAASPQRTIGGQWRGVSSSRPSIDSWICTVPVQRTVSPGAVPWGSAAHTGCAGRSRKCMEAPGWDCAIALGTTVISPAGDLKYSIDAPEFIIIVLSCSHLCWFLIY